MAQSRRKLITVDKLAKLGFERLAELVVEHADEDGACQGRRWPGNTVLPMPIDARSLVGLLDPLYCSPASGVNGSYEAAN